MNVKDIVDNKQFWGTVKPLFSEKIHLVEDETVIKQDGNNSGLLILFFSSAVKNLKKPEFSDINPLAERLSDTTLKAILKYKNNPSIVTIRNGNNNSYFHFNELVLKKFKKRFEN